MADRLDVVAVGLEDEGGIVVRVVVGPQARAAVVLADGRKRGGVQGVDLGAGFRLETDVQAAAVVAVADPEERLGVVEAGDSAAVVVVLHHHAQAERGQRGFVEGTRARVVGAGESEMVDAAHGVSFGLWQTASTLLPSGSRTKAP